MGVTCRALLVVDGDADRRGRCGGARCVLRSRFRLHLFVSITRLLSGHCSLTVYNSLNENTMLTESRADVVLRVVAPPTLVAARCRAHASPAAATTTNTATAAAVAAAADAATQAERCALVVDVNEVAGCVEAIWSPHAGRA